MYKSQKLTESKFKTGKNEKGFYKKEQYCARIQLYVGASIYA